MLPFPTYNIPDFHTNKTDTLPKRLIFLTKDPPGGSQIELIAKIASALKVDFQQDAACYSITESEPLDFKKLIGSHTELVISFGIQPSTIGLWIDLQGAGMRFLEQFVFILTIPLADLEKNANAKKILWNDMQHFMEMKAKENE